ncbi:diguanylate cyclase [Sphingomonas sp. IC081]|uniref:Diguanylate cyclase DosC n=1 Tax=Novosphingobium lindaniclasticum LE124 TaxID=1096930 RepID=T0HXM6_9SPHN|nr:hypothetical protein L284_06380 [Novosphingobium lindaniclasticum LE124]QDK33991.1 diguanylate cyclase [Sphingomonas sp. IC081]
MGGDLRNAPLKEADEDSGDGLVTALKNIVEANADDLVALFYKTLLQDDEAKHFLNYSVVETRLTSSLRAWLVELLGPSDIRESPDIQDRQRIVGEAHARIKIPVHLVMEGALVIKSRLAELIAVDIDDAAAAIANVQLVNDRIDTAIMLMSKAYMRDATARARLDEAYRLFSLDQDIGIEKEAQRASLMQWSQETLFALLGGSLSLSKLSTSQFGLWVRHRAGLMFERSPAFENLTAEIGRIDNILLPKIESGNGRSGDNDALHQLHSAVNEILFIMNDLFQVLNSMENGRDPLTRALNRRFLPSILGREITIANQNKSALTILMVDVDHFKSINDRFGHQIGDVVLKQVAQVVMENVRPSDFVFRYGGEEFLIILSETHLNEAKGIAERIRTDLCDRELDAEVPQVLKVSASIGIAEHLGHPDQNYLIKAADEALYQAKANGRNRVEIAVAMALSENR